MLTLVHNNPIDRQGDTLRVDRKFHEGMLNYVAAIRAPITTVHPLLETSTPIMDPVTLDARALPYQVLCIQLDRRGKPEASATEALRRLVSQSRVMVGYGYGVPAMALQMGKRLIACLEYDLPTQITAARSSASDPLRAAWKTVNVLREWRSTMVPAMRGAHEIHCNGYPMFLAAEPYNAKRLLYFDSRMSADMVIDDARLAERLRARTSRPVRLIYSGRYEPMKGALDAVKSAAVCLERGLEIEMDTYGQGRQLDEMRTVAMASDGRIRVHDAIPFPELVQRTYDADLFVCCHIQSDPSCTYLESMGAGLPIVGYDNRMWMSMAEASGAGAVTVHRTPKDVADAVQVLMETPGAIDAASHKAQRFAREHCFEVEFKRRTDAINAALAG